jgi:hypothetical protein
LTGSCDALIPVHVDDLSQQPNWRTIGGPNTATMKFSGIWSIDVDETAEDDNLNRWEYLTQNFDRDDFFSDADKPSDAFPTHPTSNDEFSNLGALTLNAPGATNKHFVTAIEADATIVNASPLSAYLYLQHVSFPLPTIWSHNSDATLLPTSATTNLLSTLQPRPMTEHHAVPTRVDVDEQLTLEPEPLPINFRGGFKNERANGSDSFLFAPKDECAKLEYRRMQCDTKISVVSADSSFSETEEPVSALAPLKVTKMCIPLTAYNYFYRNERDNIVRNMKRPGDPLPDPDHDFSQSKQEELLYQRW